MIVHVNQFRAKPWPLGRWRECLVLAALVGPVGSTTTSGGEAKSHEAVEGRLSDEALEGCVQCLQPDVLGAERAEGRNRRLLQACFDSVEEWGAVLGARFQPVDSHDGWGYYGAGGHGENDVRPIAYAVLVNAFLSEARPPERRPDEDRRARFRADAVAALRYLTQVHVTGGGKCLDGKAWGDQWQSAMWARSAGLGGWIIWPHLDDALKLAVARMVEHEADRFIRAAPKSSEFGDTGAEENAWNALMTGLACNMMPSHPRADQWDEAAKRYMYNTLSVAADRNDTAAGDDGRRVSEWVTTINAHPDYTVENHGLVHVGYLKLTVAELLENATHYLAGGRPVPRACLHNVGRAWDVLLRCMSWDGAPIYFGGNDWKTVHTQCTDVVMYTYLSLIEQDRCASYLEAVALDVSGRIQEEQGGFYNVRRDIEYGGLAASRLIGCYIGHAVLGAGAEPASESQFDARACGVTYLEYAKVILHRTPEKFASFTWGPKRMALALPENGSWVIWPHFASGLGHINGHDGSARNAELEAVQHEILENGFTVIGRLNRNAGPVRQDFAFVSPSSDVTVYIERIACGPTGRLAARATGVVGHECPLGQNERVLYGPHGETKVTGVGGEERTLTIDSEWLNLGNRVGYVIRRQEGRSNIIRYHDHRRGTGRVPKLQEWMSLIGDPDSALPDGPDWACLVTFLNQAHKETARLAEVVEFEMEGEQATCRVGSNRVRVDFDANRVFLHESQSWTGRDSAAVGPGR